VLVLGPGHVVSAVHISPVNRLGEHVCGPIALPGVGSGLVGTVGEGGLGDTASRVLGKEFLILESGVVLGLRERVDGLVVQGVVLLFVSGVMLNVYSPCV